MQETGEKAMMCIIYDCQHCPLLDLACVVLEEELEKEMEKVRKPVGVS